MRFVITHIVPQCFGGVGPTVTSQTPVGIHSCIKPTTTTDQLQKT